MVREKTFSSMTIGELTDLIYEVTIMRELTLAASGRLLPFAFTLSQRPLLDRKQP